MAQNFDTPAEHAVQWQLLTSEVGAPGSGAIRYAAAMHFYAHHMLSPEMLEIYRMCSKFDREDPVLIADYENVAAALPHHVSKKRNSK